MVEKVFMRREKRELEVLRLLNANPLRYIALQTAFVKRTNDSPGIFDDIFYSLVKSGRIVKETSEITAPYRLTEKGKKLLEALS